MEDPICLSRSEMKQLMIGDKVNYLPGLAGSNPWTIVQLVEKGIVVESTKYGGHRHLIEWSDCVKLELPDNFYDGVI